MSRSDVGVASGGAWMVALLVAGQAVIGCKTGDEAPPSSPLLGEGWTGSTSLLDYPKTGPVASGCPVVSLDDGAGGKPLEGRLLDALASLSSNDCVLIRNDSGAPVKLTSHLHRNTAWTTRKRVFAYDTQRITLDGALIPATTEENQQLLYFDGAANEHWKGFAVTASANGNVDMEYSHDLTEIGRPEQPGAQRGHRQERPDERGHRPRLRPPG